MNRCPTPEEIEEILSAADGAGFQALVAHVSQCDRCGRLWEEFEESSDGLDPASQSNLPNGRDERAIPPDVLRRLKKASHLLSSAGAAIGPAQRSTPRSSPPPLVASGRLGLRCPHCHAPMEVAVDTLLTDLTCGACGSQFSLVDPTCGATSARPLSEMGRFELIARLGVGSFGSVWKARDKELDRFVAIKIPRHGDMTPHDQEKFYREARAAAQLRHPNIVSVYEVGRSGDNVYIASDFIDGVTLGEWLLAQQLTGREAAGLCVKIADALHHAHEQGVVHRDLKPANILIDANGEPHLTDFGLARRDVGEVTMTLDGQVLGTPAYMSPEQALGEAHAADRRSDVYSLGVILFQLMTGELPFRGNVRMLMQQVIHNEPPSPRTLNANIARDLETITLKCLEKSPLKRYQSALEFAGDLRAYLAGRPITARPINWLQRRWRWCKIHPAAAALLAVFPIVALSVAAIAVIAAVNINAEQRKTTDALYGSLLREAKALRMARTPGYRSRAWSLLKQATALESPLIDLHELRQEAASSMGDFVAIEPLELEGFDSPVTCVELSAGPGQLFVGTDDGTITVVDPRHGSQRTLGRLGASITGLAFDAVNRILVASTNDERVIRWTLQAPGQWEKVDEQSYERQVMSPVFDAQWRCTFVRRGEGRTLEIWLYGEKVPLHVLSFEAEAFSATLDSKARLLAVGDARGELSIWDVESGENLTQLSPNIGAVHVSQFSSDSKYLACAGGDGFALFDLQSGERLSHNKETGSKSIAISPNGRLCVVSDPQGRVRLWNVIANSEFAQLAFDSVASSLDFSIAATMDFSGDGRWLCLGDGRQLRIWDLWETPEMRTIEAHNGGVPGAAFSPDGTQLASVGKDGRCVITNLHSDGRVYVWSIDAVVQELRDIGM